MTGPDRPAGLHTPRAAALAGRPTSQGSRHDLRTRDGLRADILDLAAAQLTHDPAEDVRRVDEALIAWTPVPPGLLPAPPTGEQATDQWADHARHAARMIVWTTATRGRNLVELGELRRLVLDARRARLRAVIAQVETRGRRRGADR